MSLLFRVVFNSKMGFIRNEKNFGQYEEIYLNLLRPILDLDVVPQEWRPCVDEEDTLVIKRAISLAPTYPRSCNKRTLILLFFVGVGSA